MKRADLLHVLRNVGHLRVQTREMSVNRAVNHDDVSSSYHFYQVSTYQWLVIINHEFIWVASRVPAFSYSSFH